MDKSGWLLGGIVGAILYIVISMFNSAKACDVEAIQQDAAEEYHNNLVLYINYKCNEPTAEGVGTFVVLTNDSEEVVLLCTKNPQQK